MGVLDKLCSGFNATIFTYGQTGFGNTHTIGIAFGGELDENSMVMPRLMYNIFKRIKSLQRFTETLVSSVDETIDCLMLGSSSRAIAATAMNEQSSRSHTIFTITVEATKKDEMSTVTTSKFHLVDLAGSQRSKKTQATASQGSGFVRFRDFKLTRLLQDSLGVNPIILMIACVSPADYNVAETLCYADRARKIKNKPIAKSAIQQLPIELLAANGEVIE
ncbi:chromosome-associated kinesin KIF4-like [Anastrepha obliqua]|uniref:chromosome-associated kinesin KIF4-like n=1 Tax=Anastrepha obliqua TaxID=95512 RepID=UPI00240A3A0C|nr:chromosome-associated kinesin KIF4-like [Anastrepha obliqua]XP_054742303.1 chromosome-associated kinesin KIF4-like [Anastrepha obliqua]